MLKLCLTVLTGCVIASTVIAGVNRLSDSKRVLHKEVKNTMDPAPVCAAEPQVPVIRSAVVDKPVTVTEEDLLSSYSGPLTPAVGEPLVWLSENIDAWKGWSVTGYSWGGFTEQYNPWRFKIGLIGDELEISRKYAIDAGEKPVHEPWEELVEQKPMVGFSFTVTF